MNNDWYNEAEFQEWQYLGAYYGTILDFNLYYIFEEYPEGFIRVKIRDVDMNPVFYSDHKMRTVEEAREYINQYEEKLNKLSAYEESLGFY